MAEHETPPDPALATAARHALHDEELVAAFAAAATDDAETERARGLIDRCATCADLARDIAAITAATRSLDPASVASAYIRAPRDFRLPVADAARVRPASLPARIAAAFFGGVAAFGRPVGATLATFGLVGLLVGTVGFGGLAGFGGAPAAGPGAAFATPSSDLGAAGYPPTPTNDVRTEIELTPLASGHEDGGKLTRTDSGLPGPSMTALLFAGSIGLLVLGLALLAAGARARRDQAARDRT